MPHLLLLIDGLNIVRRCYEANPAPDSAEKAESAVKVALQSMRRGLREHKPTHCMTVFDHAGKNWRHSLYEYYKAGRKPMSPYLADELERMKVQMSDEGWAIMCHPGEEADDSMYGVARAALDEGAEVIVSSNDKDLVRFVEFGARVYNHFDRTWRDEAWCLEKFGIPPRLLTDFLALMGDTVDNIPGVPRVGARTAAKLLNSIGPLTNILEAAEQGQIPGTIGARLNEFREQALLSFELATLKNTFSPLDLWWDELEAPVH